MLKKASLFVVSVAISAWGLIHLQKGLASNSWPYVEGRVIQSNIETGTTTIKTGKSRASKLTYKANILYEYRVNGVTCRSSKISFGEYSSTDQHHAKRLVSEFPKGKAVTVYYNPNQPEDAVLKPGISGFSYVVLGIGILFIFLWLCTLKV